MSGNYLKFWGTRGSSAVSGESYRHFGGNTNCVEIYHDGYYTIIDAGTGILPLGQILEEKKVRKIDLLLSHCHWDHVIGLPFFAPIFDRDTHLTIWAPFDSDQGREKLLETLFAGDFFPIKAKQIQNQITFRTIEPKSPIQIGSLTVESHPTTHPGTTYSFKFRFSNSHHNQTIGYVTDNEIFKGFQGSPSQITSQEIKPYESFINFFRGCDLFVHEAQYFPEEYQVKMGWGHSSVRNTVALIQQTLPKRWLVTHHDPLHTDEDLYRLSSLAKKLLQEHQINCTVEWVPDGYIIPL